MYVIVQFYDKKICHKTSHDYLLRFFLNDYLENKILYLYANFLIFIISKHIYYIGAYIHCFYFTKKEILYAKGPSKKYVKGSIV